MSKSRALIMCSIRIQILGCRIVGVDMCYVQPPAKYFLFFKTECPNKIFKTNCSVKCPASPLF